MGRIDLITCLAAIGCLVAWLSWSKLARTIAVESLRHPLTRTTIHRRDGDVRVEVAPEPKR